MGAQPRLTICVLVATACSSAPASSPSGTETGETTTQAGDSGSESGSSGESTSETTGPDECDAVVYDDCFAAAASTLSTCLADCECESSNCVLACDKAFEAYWACIPDEVVLECEALNSQSVTTCRNACDLATAECTCEPNNCVYLEYACQVQCHACPDWADLMYSYADSCELALPGPVASFSVPYTTLEIADEQLQIAGQPAACGDPDNPSAIWADDQHDSVLLCQAACDAFAVAGALTVSRGSPPCE